jgi:hypothetical protein
MLYVVTTAEKVITGVLVILIAAIIVGSVSPFKSWNRRRKRRDGPTIH